MALAHSPRIVTDGLVFYYDMSNPWKSWRGAPTTNLVLNPPRGFGNQSHMQVTTFDTIGPFNKTQNVARFSHTAADPRSGDQRAWTQFTLNDKTIPYTFSVYVYLEPGTEAQNSGQFWRVSQTDGNHWMSPFAEIISSEVHSWDIIGQWQRISVTFQPDPSNASNTFYVMYYNRVALGSGLVFTSGQLESNPFATPFVNGTRSNTEAVLDLTNKHQLTANNLTYTSDGLFEFSNGSINVPFSNDFDFSKEQTIFMWLHCGPTSSSARRNPYNQAYGGSGTITHEPGRTFNYYFGTHGGNSTPYVGRGSGFTVDPNELACIAVTRNQDTDTVRWFKNGVLITTASAGGYTSTNNGSSPILIGNGYTNNFQGKIPSVCIYNKELTPDQVRQNFNATRGRYGI